MGVRNILTGAGAVVGSFFGQPQLGLAIGSLIGNIVDPQRIKGPALKEFPVLGVTEGAYRQVAYGTTIIRDCQLIDWGPLDPVIVEEQQGKGGGPVVESQRLYQTYAVAIGEPIEAVRYIKRDGVMVYDLRPGSTILPESADFAGRLRIYLGDEAQLPDPDLEALPTNGVGNTPAYRGTSYFVVVRDDLTDLGGRIPTYEVEVLRTVAGVSADVTLLTDVAGYSGDPSDLQLGAQSTFNSFVDDIRMAPNGLYACGFDRDGDLFNSKLIAYDPVAQDWDDLAEPVGWPSTGSIQACAWSPDSQYLALALDTSPFVIVFKRAGDTFTRLDDTLEPITGGGVTGFRALAWDSEGARLGFSTNESSTKGVGLYDFVADQLVNLRHVESPLGVSAVGGPPFRIEFQPGAGSRYLACGNPTHTFVLRCTENPMELCASVEFEASQGGIFWSAAGNHLVGYGQYDLEDQKVNVFEFVGSVIDTETLTLVSTLTTGVPAAPNDASISADRRYLAVAPISGIVERPVIIGLGSGSTPVPVVLGALDDTGGPVRSVSFAGESGLPQYPDSAVLLSAIVADIADRCGIPAGKLDLSELTDEVRGLTLGGQYDGAGAITTLMPPYYFDLYEADKEVRAPKRGGAVKATITEADLVEDIDENALRGQDIEYPRKLQLKYLNPGQNYAAPAAVFARTTPDVRVRGEANMDLPICMDETQALQTAERILKVMWEDLNGEVTLSLPAGPFAWLAPTDCLGLSIRGALFRIRVEKVEDVDGVLKVTARRDRQSAYTSVLTALPLPPPAGPPPSLAGITQFVVLNGPGVTDSDDQLGVRIGVCGLPGTAWSGATVRYSTDAGATWVTAATLRTAARLGALTAALPGALAGYTDPTNPLRVLLIGDRQLEAVTQEQLLQEGNGAAIAYPDGTCEVLQFRDVVDEGSRQWTLRHLLRGMLATEAELHAIGAKFVMLDGTAFVPLPSALIGQTLRFQFVSLGTSPETAPIFDLVWNPAVSQTEFPPASLALTRGSGTISATWAARHRFGIDTAPVPSIRFNGFRVTLTDGTVTQVYDHLAPAYSGADTAFTGPITVTVQQLNQVTGAGPGTSGII